MQILVVVDGAEKLGSLSYLSERALPVGTRVEVPFGARTKSGVVVGEASDAEGAKATKAVRGVGGVRFLPRELVRAEEVARLHGVKPSFAVTRLGPRESTGRALDAGEVGLRSAHCIPGEAVSGEKRVVVGSPGTRGSLVAAAEAVRMSGLGQVLVVCPTSVQAEKVVAAFSGGAALLSQREAWEGWLAGSVRVGVVPASGALWGGVALAGVVVLDEHHPAHRAFTTPHTSSLWVGEWRRRHEGVALSVVGGSPSGRALLDAEVVFVGSAWPRVEVVDRREVAPSERSVPPRLSEVVEEMRAAGTPLTVVVEEKATQLCGRCNAVSSGRECSCGERRTFPVGWDAERVRGVWGSDVRVATRTQMLAAASEEKRAYGILLPDVERDLSQLALDPEGEARGFLLRAASLVEAGGVLLLATSQAEHPLLSDLRRGDLSGSIERSLADLEMVGAPPFGEVFVLSTASKPKTAGWPGRVLGTRESGKGYVTLVGAAPGEEERVLAELSKKKGALSYL